MSNDDDLIRRGDALAEIELYRSDWSTARDEIAAIPADPVTNAGSRPRSIEGCLQMTHPTDEEHAYLHPGYKKPYPIETVLRDLAAQEGCDGEPYDAMVFAADAITALRAQLAEARAERDAVITVRDMLGNRWATEKDRADRAEAALAALEAAPRVNETLKSEHDRADVLTALPAAVAPSLRITGPNSDGEYWLHIKAGGRSGGVNLGGEHGPICKRLLDAASEIGAKE